ncbi:hypothetical protein EW146_g4500 [Bondarzewia mesenterica]|uniref:Ornithine cyclodeaminase n=1 Tax=Bondarzewia mesenterica TaxID=1095465 RepID=A0A4S4M067_9AGAM|nr:hypothetical protein EW146_g4500 [Bondarzewia mesenterica]
MSLRILSCPDVDRISGTFTTEQLQTLMAQVFFYISDGRDVVTPHRSSIQMLNHRALFMPARIAGIGTSIKVVSVPTAAGSTHGLPGSTLVLDETTGAAKALVNASSLTALRTAAGSLLATTLLYPPTISHPKMLVAFGAGKQILAHVDLLLATYPSLQEVTIVNRSMNQRTSTLVSEFRSRHPSVKFDVGVHNASSSDLASPFDLPTAVASADIICTATSSTVPLFPSASVRPGTHLILVGSYTIAMAEIDTDLVRRAKTIVVDSREACLIEAGELIAAGVGEDEMIELGELVQETNPGALEGTMWEWKRNEHKCDEVRKAGDVTIFKSVGVGAQDVAIAAAVVDRAKELGIGATVEDYDA